MNRAYLYAKPPINNYKIGACIILDQHCWHMRIYFDNNQTKFITLYAIVWNNYAKQIKHMTKTKLVILYELNLIAIAFIISRKLSLLII